MKVMKETDIYLTRKRNPRQIDVVQYDTGVQLVFTVKDFSIPSGATAALYVQKPSGKFVLQEDGVTVAENTITINLENQAITEHGKAPYQVSIKSGSDVITTFTGLIMVEKSMKDAGATESKTVIHAFDEAVSDHVAEFQAKAEQIVAACIATMPDDYSTMEAKVNDLANAVKGYLSGAVVFADDVSTVEHSPVVKVHGKNLLKPEAGASWQCTASVASDGKITLTNTETDGVAFARVGTLELKKGKTYVYTGHDQNNITRVLTWKTGTTIDSWYPVNGVPYTAKEDVVVDIAVYMADIGVVGNTSSIYIQIEEGEVATDYEPYIDPSTVTVRRCGKNLFNTDNTAGDVSGTYRGWIVNPNEEDVAMHVTDKDTSVSITGMYLGLNENGIDASYGYTWIVEDGQVKSSFITDKFKYVSVFPNTDYAITQLKKRFNIQVERGTKPTAYEECQTTTHIPTADGTVSGLTSLSPSMTILTDTEGVIVECEYNRDTNKVIDKLIKAITALGGTV